MRRRPDGGDAGGGRRGTVCNWRRHLHLHGDGGRGARSFKYTITDQDGDTSTATVTVIWLRGFCSDLVGSASNLTVDEDGFAHAANDAANGAD